MEAKLNDYAGMKYDLQRWKDLKDRIRKLRSTAEFIEANLDLESIPNEDEWPEDFDDDDE